MDDREIRTRLNSCMDVDSWVTEFNTCLFQNVGHPVNELFNSSQKFSDWRLSYGVHKNTEAPVYFLSFYPPFCRVSRATYHYRNLAELATDVMQLENFLSDIDAKHIDAQDIIACVFAISRDKESFELFQEQKDLMVFGLKHFNLDNYYQDSIKKLTSEYYEQGTVLGKKLSISFLNGK